MHVRCYGNRIVVHVLYAKHMLLYIMIAGAAGWLLLLYNYNYIVVVVFFTFTQSPLSVTPPQINKNQL